MWFVGLEAERPERRGERSSLDQPNAGRGGVGEPCVRICPNRLRLATARSAALRLPRLLSGGSARAGLWQGVHTADGPRANRRANRRAARANRRATRANRRGARASHRRFSRAVIRRAAAARSNLPPDAWRSSWLVLRALRCKVGEPATERLDLVVGHPLVLHSSANPQHEHPENRHHHRNSKKQQRTHVQDACEPGTCERVPASRVPASRVLARSAGTANPSPSRRRVLPASRSARSPSACRCRNGRPRTPHPDAAPTRPPPPSSGRAPASPPGATARPSPSWATAAASLPRCRRTAAPHALRRPRR